MLLWYTCVFQKAAVLLSVRTSWMKNQDISNGSRVNYSGKVNKLHVQKKSSVHNTSENVPSDICTQRRLKSVCASAPSTQRIRRPHWKKLYPWLSRMRPVKILIRLRECAG